MKTIKVLNAMIKLTIKIDKKHVVGIFIFSLLSLIIPIFGLFNTQFIMNSIQSGIDFYSASFIISLILFPIISLVTEINSRLLSYISMRYNDIIDYKFSCLILEKVHTQGLKEFENPEFYDLLQRAEEAGGIYPYSIMSGLISIITLIISSFSYIAILFAWKSWTVLFLLVFPFLSSIQIISISKNEYKILFNRTTIERKSWYYAHLQNKDVNIKETILFSLNNYFFNKFKEIREHFLVENKKMYIKRNVTTTLIQAISIISTMVILYMIFYEASMGIILIGSLMTYISTVSNLKTNFNNIASAVFKLHSDSLYSKNITDFLSWNSDDKRSKGTISIDKINKIELKHVYFKYNNRNKYALNDINLTLKNGEKYVFVGRNGSGKTTLSKLILGFYDNYEGEILVNGVNLKEIEIESYRKCISAVFQDYTLYQSTIEEAINVSDLSKTDEIYLQQAAQKANATEFINRYPDKYKQQVGNWFQNGVQLSGGEWQKLAIARAFYRTSASMVLCDEPSSSLDPISEKKVYKNFLELTENKLGIFITHRLKNYDLQGTIIVIKNGSLNEMGTSKELLKHKGEFSLLYYQELEDDE